METRAAGLKAAELGSSMDRHVSIQKVSFPGRQVFLIHSALQNLLHDNLSAVTVRLHIGSNDIKRQQSEKLNLDFSFLIDSVLVSATHVAKRPLP